MHTLLAILRLNATGARLWLTGCGWLRQNWTPLTVTVHLADQPPSLARTVAPLLLPELVTTVGIVPSSVAVLAEGCMTSHGEMVMLLQSG